MSEPSPLPPPDRQVLIGRLVKVRGLKGDLKVAPLTSYPERFEQMERCWVLLPDGQARSLTLKRAKVDVFGIYVRFEEAGRREYAEELLGGELVIDESDRFVPDEDEFFVDDLVGCVVRDRQLGPIGQVRGVQEIGAYGLLEVSGEHGEVLIPIVRAIILRVDLVAQAIEVDLPEGLVEPAEDSSAAGDGS